MSPFKTLKTAFSDFLEDQCTISAAALAYYTIFALPPLLILVLKIVNAIWHNPDAVSAGIQTQFAGMVGDSTAASIGDMLKSAQTPAHRSVGATILASLVLALGATGAFGQLQTSLNRAWEVKTDPKQGIMKTVVKRIFSFGMVLGIAFMLLISLMISAALTAFGGTLHNMVGGASETIMKVVELIVSFGVITLLFAMMFKFIPDAVIDWKDVWLGAAITALLFTLGKFGIGLYLGHSKPGQAFGAAAAIAVLLVWFYYSGLIVLFGAELTQSIMESKGRHIEPSKGAVKYVEGKDQVVEKPPTA